MNKEKIITFVQGFVAVVLILYLIYGIYNMREANADGLTIDSMPEEQIYGMY